METRTDFGTVQTAWTRTLRVRDKYDAYWSGRRGAGLPVEKFAAFDEVWLEIGAGTGKFFEDLARRNPRALCIAVERDRMRGKALEKRGRRAGLENLHGLRGNIIPTLIAETPDRSLDRVYILYPCPWPKNSHRKNRWYNHPVMAHIVRALKPGGQVIWASDQKWYIDEAAYACRHHHGLEILAHGPLSLTEGRTKFESTFLAEGLVPSELVCRKIH